MTISSTTAGNALVCVVNGVIAANSISSCTDGGDTFSTCTALGGSTDCTNSLAGTGRTGILAIMSGAGGKTTLTCNISGTNGGFTWTCGVFEIHKSSGSISFDNGGNISLNTAATPQSGTALTLSGSNDTIVRVAISANDDITGINLGYTLNIDAHTDGEAYKVNTNSGAAPSWTFTAADTLVEAAIAVK